MWRCVFEVDGIAEVNDAGANDSDIGLAGEFGSIVGVQ
jgi:hypothetical protein